MLTYSQAFYELKGKLHSLYDEREAAATAHELMHHITGLDRTQRLLQKDRSFSEEQQQQFEQKGDELLTGKPIQYVTHGAWFMGREYYVNEHVLIPRPETEELVQWVIEQFPDPRNAAPKILDIGTGSGCIAISLKLAMPSAEVMGWDISATALEVAARNARALNADVIFAEMDILSADARNKAGVYDVIVSNPPYIPVADKVNMHSNVKDFEPEVALFVPDSDPLVFYRAIAEFGTEHLTAGGGVYCELDAGHAVACKELFERAGYSKVEVRKDMHGNWRMLRGYL